MENKKVSLALEGGGMRGAYTAGALCWLIDEGIEFDQGYGISTGALHLCNFLLGSKKNLKDISTKHITDKSVVGIRSIIREGKIVSYDYLFDHILNEVVGFKMDDVKKTGKKAKIGLYDMQEAKTVYLNVEDMNNSHIKAACSLPIIGSVIKINGKEYLDGGITKMIPIEESINDGYDRTLVITTKPGGYRRKPAKAIVVNLMKLVYPKCKQIGEDYRVRHINYNKQIDIIEQLIKEGKAVYSYPSRTVEVSRLKGEPDKLLELFELGRSDMEAQRDKIYALFK